jgi:hypothetical protein
MPKNKVSDPITDQEIAFARLVLSGTMTDRQAAESAGLHPDSAAYTKSKPRVRAYMLEHRAAVEQQLVQQEADGIRRHTLDRQQVLDRLWELAKLNPDLTRGSITGQVKAISMIIAMLNFIPDRRAVSSENKSAPALPAKAQIYVAEWLRRQQAATTDAQPVPAPDPDLSSRPERSVVEGPAVSPNPNQSTFANRLTPSEAPASPYVPLFGSVPDLRVPFSIKNPFVRPR